MKKSVLLLLLLVISNFTYTQGLENIIVERYYVSDADDSASSIGLLPVGSVTYRVFVDMAPEYKLQSVWGSPEHPLTFSSTTTFFNNEDRGDVTPSYTKNHAKFNTVMLDSWVSMGAGCVGNLGVLKSEDNGVATVVNSDDVLQNDDTLAGIPIYVQDGLILGTPQNVVTVGLDNNLEVLNATSQAGGVFSSMNGAWASLYGSKGPTPSNTLLIGQFTTKGIFTFQFSIQIKDTLNNIIEQYVPSNPTGSEVLFSGLNYSSNLPPSVSIVSPISGAEYLNGVSVIVQADAYDFDGYVEKVKFFVDGVFLSVDSIAPYEMNYSAVYGNHILSCMASDDQNDSAFSTPVTIHVGSTSITESSDNNSVLRLYPNPATSQISLELLTKKPVDKLSWEIFDMVGNKLAVNQIENIALNAKILIDVASLRAGNYLLKVSMDDICESKLITKK
ncbi:MAG: Ig-like domain-containing protein [Bacteroidales bacterium]